MDPIINEAWSRLRAVSTLTFRAISEASVKTGWDGLGKGTVIVEMPDSHTLVFRETGAWTTAGRKEMAFHNIYRWKLQPNGIELEHLRFGPEKPVFLFLLEANGPRELRSSCPHACAEDSYQAVLTLGNPLLVIWKVNGPKLAESIEYQYFQKGGGLAFESEDVS